MLCVIRVQLEKGDFMKDVLDSYDRVSLEFIGNSNSLHELGLNSKRIEEAASRQILDVLGLDDYDVIYTSGNSESFSTILFNCSGNVYSDAIDVLSICDLMGVPVSGDDVYLFSTRDEVMIDARYKHIDIDLDKKYSNLNDYDFITIGDYIPFFGVLLKKKNIFIKPLINGGKSVTKYRSGTSPTSLIVSFSKFIKNRYKSI